jgi:Zn-finger nucleic acid-binding protein
MLDLYAHSLPNPGRAYADTFAHAAQAFAQFSSRFHRPAVRDLLAKEFAAPARAFAPALVGVPDASVSVSCDIPAGALAPVGHRQDAAVSVVRVLLVLKAMRACEKSPVRRDQQSKEDSKQNDTKVAHDFSFLSAWISVPASHSQRSVVQLAAADRMPFMQAEALHCPNCGAAVSSDAPQCQYCNSRLAAVVCPSCFALMFIGSKHCPRCGSGAAPAETANLAPRQCPRCRVEMQSVKIGTMPVRECAQCAGLWVDVSSFEKICAEREQQAAVLGAATPAPGQTVGATPNRISYLPCPECAQLMNRINFAKCSGVIVDVCKGHGTWFDRDELSRIVEFVRGGGLETSRAREKVEIGEARRQLQQEQLAADMHRSSIPGIGDEEDHRAAGIASARGLLKMLLD